MVILPLCFALPHYSPHTGWQGNQKRPPKPVVQRRRCGRGSFTAVASAEMTGKSSVRWRRYTLCVQILATGKSAILRYSYVVGGTVFQFQKLSTGYHFAADLQPPAHRSGASAESGNGHDFLRFLGIYAPLRQGCRSSKQPLQKQQRQHVHIKIGRRGFFQTASARVCATHPPHARRVERAAPRLRYRPHTAGAAGRHSVAARHACPNKTHRSSAG